MSLGLAKVQLVSRAAFSFSIDPTYILAPFDPIIDQLADACLGSGGRQTLASHHGHVLMPGHDDAAGHIFQVPQLQVTCPADSALDVLLERLGIRHQNGALCTHGLEESFHQCICIVVQVEVTSPLGEEDDGLAGGGLASFKDDPEQPDQSKVEFAHAGSHEREQDQRASESTGNTYLGMDVLEGCAVDS